ncbi:hypothetical protein K461DRAFT_245669, partial [Myriangium duriaei CBS 260.36]
MDNPTSLRMSTAWLDGLRGFAALIVVFHHFGLAFWQKSVYAEVQNNNSILQLPILKFLYAGDAMVAIFFIVSGYSLSIKPLSLMRKSSDTRAQLFSSLASAIFRRPIRLLLPCIVSTFIYFHGWVLEPTPYIESSFLAQMKDWVLSLNRFLDFFTHDQYPRSSYDRHTWTIPIEFRCSCFLYLTQAATSHFSSKARLSILATAIIVAFCYNETWMLALFWSGMALCEINMIRDANTLSVHSASSGFSTWAMRLSKAVIVLVGAHLAAIPLFQHKFAPSYGFLDYIHLPGTESLGRQIWVCAGCLMIVTVISRTASCKRFFSSPVAKYLGRISFSLYLVHGPVLRGLGYSLAVVIAKLVGNDTPLKYNIAMMITMAITLPVVFALSHLFCIAIDEPIVQMARW